MKILHINAVYGIGSTGTIVKDLHELALSQGMESFVAYSTSNMTSSDIKNGYMIGNAFGKKLHALLYRLGGKQAYFSRFSTIKLIKHIEKIKPDVVNLHNLHSNYVHLNKLLDFLAKEKIKTVITLHDCWFYTGGCYHYVGVDCDKWQNQCGDCPKRFTDLCAYISENSHKVLDDRKKYFGAIENLTVLGVSYWVTKEAQKSFLKDKNFITIKNGIDTNFFVDTASDFRRKYGLEDKFVIVGLASKFFQSVNKKTYNELVSSLDDDERLVLLGCNNKQKRQLPKNVIGFDFITNKDELRKIYSMADVFANCSREETLSLVTVEVQSCGTPVVVYANTGIKETVINERTGYVVKNGDYKDFVQKIKEIKNKGKKFYKKNCRTWILEEFNLSTNYFKLLKFYETL